jgi:hypothetical protein
MTQGRRANRARLQPPEGSISSPVKVHSRAIVQRCNYADRCTIPAAVTKSLLDRIFSSRFESWKSEKIFVEDFRKDIFFVLVCGPSLLIEIFSRCSENRPAVRSSLPLENERFLSAII